MDVGGTNGTVVPDQEILAATIVATDANCYGSNTGNIKILNATGGGGSYHYSINNGANWQSGIVFENLIAGTYQLLIRDANLETCIIDLDGETGTVIGQPAVLNATVGSTNVTCNGGNDGTITVNSPTGGYGTYEYRLNSGTWQSSGSFTDLANGNYSVQVRDAAHTSCVVVLNATLNISQPTVLSAAVGTNATTCHGTSTGAISINDMTGGSGSYEFSINGGPWQSSASFSGLAAGTYQVAIRDANHHSCVVDLDGINGSVVPDAPILAATVLPTDANCFGSNTGEITVLNATGGSGSYQYYLSPASFDWQSGPVFQNLAAGTYQLLIRDANYTSCVIDLDGEAGTVIGQPAVLNATVGSTNVTCNGANDGTITVSSQTGGNGTYDYRLNTGSWQSSGSFTGLANGDYSVQIRDAAYTNCVVVLNASLTITQPPVLSATVNSSNVTCNGGSDGTITVNSPTGGYGTYEYRLNSRTWQSSGSFTDLANGNYSVQVRDAAHTSCVVVLNATLNISQPTVLSAA